MRNLAILLTGLTMLTGCPADDDPSGTDGDTDTDTDTDTSEPPSYVLQGTITDTDGNPVAGANIRFCNVVICYQQFSTDTGGYGFIRGDGNFAFRVDSADHPTASTPLVSVEDGSTRTMDVVMPAYDMEMAVPTASAEHQLASNLYVTFSSSDLEMPDGVTDPIAGGAFVPSTATLPMDEDPSGGGTLAGVWYLAEYDAKATGDALPFRVTDAASLGLTDGDTVEVYVHSYKRFVVLDQTESQWASAGTATVANGEVTGTLPYFATVAMFKK